MLPIQVEEPLQPVVFVMAQPQILILQVPKPPKQEQQAFSRAISPVLHLQQPITTGLMLPAVLLLATALSFHLLLLL